MLLLLLPPNVLPCGRYLALDKKSELWYQCKVLDLRPKGKAKGKGKGKGKGKEKPQSQAQITWCVLS